MVSKSMAGCEEATIATEPWTAIFYHSFAIPANQGSSLDSLTIVHRNPGAGPTTSAISSRGCARVVDRQHRRLPPPVNSGAMCHPQLCLPSMIHRPVMQTPCPKPFFGSPRDPTALTGQTSHGKHSASLCYRPADLVLANPRHGFSTVEDSVRCRKARR